MNIKHTIKKPFLLTTAVCCIFCIIYHIAPVMGYCLWSDSLRPMSSGLTDNFRKINQTRDKVEGLLDIVAQEHNRTAAHASEIISGFNIIESREKYIGEGGKLWARVIIEFQDGQYREYIFKQEYSYAMDEIGAEVLRVMNIDMPHTRLYGNNLFLIQAIGQFNLNKILPWQYQDTGFSLRLARLAGAAAARSIVVGLADRKGDNLRLILDSEGMPVKVLNVDLSSAFALTGRHNLKSAITEGALILEIIIQNADRAGVPAETLNKMAVLFLQGFQEQLLELQYNYPAISKGFSDIDPDAFDKIDRMWSLMDNVKAKGGIVLNFINPDKTDIGSLKGLLHNEILANLSCSKASRKRQVPVIGLFSTAA